MGFNFKRLAAAVSAFVVTASSAAVPTRLAAVKTLTASAASNASTNVLEYLDRGISAVNTGSGMLVNWRFLTNDADDAVFKLYRDGTLIYTSNAGEATCYLDKSGSASSKYRVDTVVGGKVTSSENCRLTSANSYFDIPLSPPSSIYSPNDMSVGDVDGDGQYELFLKWDPNNSKDNSQKGKTDPVYIDCYTLEGKRLWRINLGKNIRAGAHYTQFYVGDFDLDGKAEMTCKTADGTVDGTGKTIGDASKDYRNSNGYVLTGPEYYTLFDGATGAALDTVDYTPARGTVKSWGDSYGNRVDRFWGTVAYLDGVHPCVVTGRGYYTRMTATAYTVKDKKLVKMWAFDTGNSSSAAGYGDGNHNSMPADVDGDGKQEIITGSTCIDDNGKVLWCLNKGHGDAMHVADLDPTNTGLEAWICHEDKPYGVSLVDCDTGKIIFHNDGSGDTGRCAADNIWAKNPGAECWGNGNEVKGVNGQTLSCRRPAINFFSYWDGDLEREILDGYTDSPATISKMKDDGTLTTLLSTTGCYTCNTTKGTPCLSADIFGDWREELIVRAADSKSIRIYCTTYDTDYRVTTLMHDPQYRMQVSTQNTAYNQPPHPSFFLGTGYDLPARNDCQVNGAPTKPAGKTGAVIDTQHSYKIRNVNSGLYLEVTGAAAANGTNVQQGTNEDGAVWKFEDAGDGYYRIYSSLGDGKTYLLDIDYGKTENGTNIGIWGDTASDAQLYKLVDNGDGSYTICTKVTGDESCLGVSGGSKENGANVLEWACNGSDDQKWTLEIKVMPVDGTLFKQLVVNDTANYLDWKISPTTAQGGAIFGDRDFTFTSLPSEFSGCESILTACDSKMFTSEQASFYAGADMNVYILLDQRVEAAGVPSWLSDWSKTDMTANSSNDVVFNVYKKLYSKGDKVSLGINCTSTGNVINYSVFAKAVTVSGKLFTQLEVFDNENSADWKVAENAAIGGSVYGDREVTYTSLPEFLIGTEYLTPACDSKNSTSDLAKFVTGDNIILYAAVDSRVSSTPAFLNGWESTGETAKASNDVVYNIYSKAFRSGETVILGTNGQSSGCVGYTVFAAVQKADVTTTTTTTTITTTTTTTTVSTTVPDTDDIIYGDANCDGKIDISDAVMILQAVSNADKYGADGYDETHITLQGVRNGDCAGNGDGLTPKDALAVQKFILELITELPET